MTFELVRDYVDDVVEVTEEEIEDAMRFFFREHGLVAEGAGATAVAALRAGRVEVAGETVAVVSGRNVSAETFANVLAR